MHKNPTRDTHIPKEYDWASLRSKVGEPLEAHYLATLHKLGQETGMLGAIFKAQNKIQDPAKLFAASADDRRGKLRGDGR